MRKFFMRKKSSSPKQKRKTDGVAKQPENDTVPAPQGNDSSLQSTSRDDQECLSDASPSARDRHFDGELDKHMIQMITDVKYVKKRPKFVAVGEVNFQRECLDAHNDVRSKYGCQKLVWSQELADLAHTWAVKLADRGRILYPEIPGIGENIRLSFGDEKEHLPSGEEITEAWSQEAEGFDFSNPRWHPNCQHFTQIVWKDTYEMGVARSWNTAKNRVAIVAFYRPPGNLNGPGAFKSNVPSELNPDDASVKSPVPRVHTATVKRSVTISDPEVRQ